ncbi:MAG: ribosomal protein S18-alanine N-acetyltransferase [Actinomycetia bacterium]|nr:ribosomal protein S18-alanine N-acetyltransferase [Actinomycetes bacterium]
MRPEAATSATAVVGGGAARTPGEATGQAVGNGVAQAVGDGVARAVGVVALVPMTAAHIEAVMWHEAGMFGPEAWSANAYREELADRRHRAYVAAVDAAGTLLGWAGMRVVGDEAEICTVGTIPAARRRGIARALVRWLLDEAGKRRVRVLFLEVRVDNDAARALYASEGFAEVGRRRGYYENGRVDAMVMCRVFGKGRRAR